MAELIEIKRVVIGPENLTASVRLADDAPIMTSEDLEGTTYVYRLLPHIVEHEVADAEGGIFREVMGSTDLADLLAHVTLELLMQTNLLKETPAVRTWADPARKRSFKIELACADDVLVLAALSCGAWIMDWAYRTANDPDPDIEAIVAGLVQLVENVGDEGEDLVVDYDAPKPPEEEPDPADAQAAVDGAEGLGAEAFDDERDTDYTGQIDFSKQYVFGKQQSYVEDDAAAANTAADAEEPASAEELTTAEQLEEDAAEAERQLWTDAPDLSERVAIKDRDAAMEAEIDRLLGSNSTLAGTREADATAAEALLDEASAQASDAPELEVDQASAQMEAEVDALMASLEVSQDAYGNADE